jgi:internalin A
MIIEIIDNPKEILQLEHSVNVSLKGYEIDSEVTLDYLEECLDDDGVDYICSDGKVVALQLIGLNIVDIDPVVGGFTGLIYLDLSSNSITDISVLSSLVNLESLYLFRNQIKRLQPISGLVNLRQLIIHNNPIEDPWVIKNFTQLEELYCSRIGLKDIDFLEALTNLKELIATLNEITDVSPLIKMPDLTTARFESNQIKIIPEGVAAKYSWLQTRNIDVSFQNNPLQYPPVSVIDLGAETVKDYYKRSARFGHAPLSEGRIIVIGGGGSGKSSLIDQVLNDAFEAGKTQTNGIKIENWKHKREDGRELTFHIWDFGGQEIQHAVHKFFFTAGCLYVLVLDNRKEEEPEYWLQQIESLGGKAPVLVVFNKQDENTIEITDRKYLKDKYPNIVGYFETSCKTGYGIQKFRSKLIEFANGLETVEEQFPHNWFSIKKEIEDRTSGSRHYLDYTTYREICNRNNAAGEKIQNLLLQYFTTIGAVTWFGDTYLNYLHVLSPAWITQGVYKIITSKKTIERAGKINIADFEQLLMPVSEEDYKYDHTHYGYILSMMKKFDLCYSPDDKDILIPSTFGKTPKVEYNEFRGEGVRTYVLQFKEYMPMALIHRFIAKELPNVYENNYWYSGIVINDTKSDVLAMVQADKEAKRIYIRIKDGASLGMWEHIRRELAGIAASYAMISYNELILLDQGDENTVTYDDLISHITARKPVYFHPKLQRDFNVGYLIGLFESRENTLDKFKPKMKSKAKKAAKLPDFVVNILNNNSPNISPQIQANVNVDINVQVINNTSIHIISECNYLLDELDGSNKELKEALEKVVHFAKDAKSASVGSDVKEKGWGRKLKKVVEVLAGAGDQVKKIADGGDVVKSIFKGIKELAGHFDLKDAVEYVKHLV